MNNKKTNKPNDVRNQGVGINKIIGDLFSLSILSAYLSIVKLMRYLSKHLLRITLLMARPLDIVNCKL